MNKQFLISAVAGLGLAGSALAADSQYVISISVDGMGSKYVNSLLATNELPTIKRILTEGSGTLNARTDAEWAITLPNHICQMTGRGVNGTTGHNWTGNGDPAVGQTLATNKGSYIASAFDVAHDNGLRTAMWSGKSKFSLFRDSYNATNGALDTTGVDNGRNKMDYSYISNGIAASTLTSDFTAKMNANPYNFSFVHYQDPDAAGHSYGWGSANYNTALKNVDTQIGNILTMIENSSVLKGKTTIVITADHGGHSTTHGDMGNPDDYTIPFLTWGNGTKAGGDLYAMNTAVRLNPGTSNVLYTAPLQPIRNGEAGNVSLDLLGLGAIPGSTINSGQTLAVPEPTSLGLLSVGAFLLGRRRRVA